MTSDALSFFFSLFKLTWLALEGSSTIGSMAVRDQVDITLPGVQSGLGKSIKPLLSDTSSQWLEINFSM